MRNVGDARQVLGGWIVQVSAHAEQRVDKATLLVKFCWVVKRRLKSSKASTSPRTGELTKLIILLCADDATSLPFHKLTLKTNMTIGRLV